MAQKSKTQRAKASAAKAARKEQAAAAAAAAAELAADDTATAAVQTKPAKAAVEKKEAAKPAEKKTAKAAAKPKKERFKFFKDVRSEMKRVTWPTRQEVIRWSIVVVIALIFFGLFVALLDNVIVTPLLYAISGIGA